MSRNDLTDFEWRVIEPLPIKPRGEQPIYRSTRDAEILRNEGGAFTACSELFDPVAIDGRRSSAIDPAIFRLLDSIPLSLPAYVVLEFRDCPQGSRA